MLLLLKLKDCLLYINYKKWKGWRVANLRPIFEPILWFQKPYKIGTTIADNVINNNVGAWNEEAIKKYCVNHKNNNFYDNIIKVDITKYDSGMHVNQKPVKLMELLISLVTKENAIILDPFAGSGTDIDENNINIATKRILDECYQLELKL